MRFDVVSQNLKRVTSVEDFKVHENFFVSSESPSKCRKFAVYRFLISFLVQELLRSKDLKNYRKKWYEKCAVLNKINQN